MVVWLQELVLPLPWLLLHPLLQRLSDPLQLPRP
jgi:hypothetical protein